MGLWRAVQRGSRGAWEWFDDRTGTSRLFSPLARHLVPPGSKWWYVFGSATLVAFVLQVVTGVALAFSYVPSSGQAYDSLKFITLTAPLGHLLRGAHYFGASAMVLFIGVHAIRTFLFAAYKYPREMGWLSGAALLLLTMLMGFTGQLLRWDQNAVWSVVVAAEQAGRVPGVGKYLVQFVLGGDTIGGSTLSRFFALHVFLVPAIIFAILALHLFLVVRNGISEPPVARRPVDPATYRHWYHDMLRREGVPFWPDSVWRDVVFGVVVVVGIFALAEFVGPPKLGLPPDPAIINASPAPDWYLLWYFGVLAVLPHGAEPYVIVGGPLLAGVVLLAVPFISNRGERSPRRRPWAVAVVLAIVLMVGGFWWLAARHPWVPDFGVQPLQASAVGPLAEPASRGLELFNARGCHYCHNIAGSGGHRGPALDRVGDRLTAASMAERIAVGGYNMPAYGSTLTAQQIEDLVAFLRTRSEAAPR